MIDKRPRVLVVTTMFPNKSQPHFGVFVKERLKALSALCDLTIISPQPYFPFIRFLGKYRERLDVPKQDSIDGLPVLYPRFFSIPGLCKPLDGLFLAVTIKKLIRGFKKKGITFDVIDAHLAFPDGYAAVLAGKKYSLPVTITLRGHDINHLPQYPVRKKQVEQALKRAQQVFSVCEKLLEEAKIILNMPREKGVVTYNGVDKTLFLPIDKQEARAKIGMGQKESIILSAGYLVPRKGFDILIDALKILKEKYNRECNLIIIGKRGGEYYTGEELKNQVKELHLEESVLFIDKVAHENMKYLYSAADVFCLASSKEGLPNVVIESFSCGTPAIATNVWGIPEAITNDNVGTLVERDSEDFAQAINSALDKEWDRDTITEHAENFDWNKTALILLNEFNEIVKNK